MPHGKDCIRGVGRSKWLESQSNGLPTSTFYKGILKGQAWGMLVKSHSCPALRKVLIMAGVLGEDISTAEALSTHWVESSVTAERLLTAILSTGADLCVGLESLRRICMMRKNGSSPTSWWAWSSGTSSTARCPHGWHFCLGLPLFPSNSLPVSQCVKEKEHLDRSQNTQAWLCSDSYTGKYLWAGQFLCRLHCLFYRICCLDWIHIWL